MNVIEHNRVAWNRESTQGSEWSTPVTSEVIAAAREGVWTVILTPTRKVPASWFGDLRGKNVLFLASGGGQRVGKGVRTLCIKDPFASPFPGSTLQ